MINKILKYFKFIGDRCRCGSFFRRLLPSLLGGNVLATGFVMTRLICFAQGFDVAAKSLRWQYPNTYIFKYLTYKKYGILMSWNKQQWEQRIRSLCADYAHIAWTAHARHQMRDRQVSMGMAIDVLTKGSIRLHPETDIKTGHVVCRMERFCAGHHLAVCVAMPCETSVRCIIVTVIKCRRA